CRSCGDRMDAAPDDRLRLDAHPTGEGEAAGGPKTAGPAIQGIVGTVSLWGGDPRRVSAPEGVADRPFWSGRPLGRIKLTGPPSPCLLETAHHANPRSPPRPVPRHPAARRRAEGPPEPCLRRAEE